MFSCKINQVFWAKGTSQSEYLLINSKNVVTEKKTINKRKGIDEHLYANGDNQLKTIIEMRWETTKGCCMLFWTNPLNNSHFKATYLPSHKPHKYHDCDNLGNAEDVRMNS